MLVLYVVALVNGTLSVIFDVAYQSYLPQIVPRQQLVARNQRLELSGAAAQVLGPSLAGYLLAVLGGAVAVLLDAFTYLVSAAAVLGSPRFRRPMARPFDPGGLWGRLLSGVRLVGGDRILRDLALSTATFNLASSCIFAVLVVFATRDVGVHPALFGLIFGLGNVGFVVGALLVGRLSRRLGVGRTLVVGSWLGAMATIVLPFAAGPLAILALFAGRFIGAAGASIFNVNAYSVRQDRVPDEILGRVNATFRLVDWGTLPIGALLGGTIGSLLGLRYALVFAALLGASSLLLLVRSPVRLLGGLGNEPAGGRLLRAQARPAE
jgi:MFS family permease